MEGQSWKITLKRSTLMCCSTRNCPKWSCSPWGLLCNVTCRINSQPGGLNRWSSVKSKQPLSSAATDFEQAHARVFLDVLHKCCLSCWSRYQVNAAALPRAGALQEVGMPILGCLCCSASLSPGGTAWLCLHSPYAPSCFQSSGDWKSHSKTACK